MSKKEFWQQCDHKKLEQLLSETKDIGTLKHIQAVYLKACHDMSAEAIGRITGFSKGYIWHIHSAYRKIGDKAFVLCKRGGIYHRNLSAEQEESLLADFTEIGNAGRILEVGNIKKRYEELAGKQVHKSVVYRMLARHGWRKLAPRPKHPKNDKAAMEAFKKTSHDWYKTI